MKTNCSLREKIASIVVGPVTGMLPPRWQMYLTNNNVKASSIMSTTSRIVNGFVAAYALASHIIKPFGIDIDPTGGDYLMWSATVIGVDSLIREGIYAFQYFGDSNYRLTDEPWGEPITSIIDSNINKEWYAKYEKDISSYVDEEKLKRNKFKA